MKTQIVIGIGFGDEGKGTTTDFLVNKSFGINKPDGRTVVVRFSGGHQAGHTVTKKRPGKQAYSHVHSQTGSGSLSGADTFYSRYCTFYPLSFVREYNSIVNNMSIMPKVFVDPLAPVTTVYDVAYNRVKEKVNQHGSCGVGFAATVKRHEKCKLYFQDIAFKTVFEAKLTQVEEYYKSLCAAEDIDYFMMEDEIGVARAMEYHKAVDLVRNMRTVRSAPECDVFGNYSNVIFEGSQGVMLDMDWGFFPNVTMAHTTSRNAMEIIERNGLPAPEVFYVMRAYSTRHGNGPMPTEEEKPRFVRTISEETNVTNNWQGDLRTGILDADMLSYAIACDSHYTPNCSKSVVITCLDQVESVKCTKATGPENGHTVSVLTIETKDQLLDALTLPRSIPVYCSHSPFSNGIKLIAAGLFEGAELKV